METALQTFSPREIQARVRGGESAEVIAAETGWPLDKVLRYAEPLLAERAFIAEQAQKVEVRRSGGGATLLDTTYLAIGADPEAGTVEWDAWRRDDGRWVVVATYADSTGSHAARWTYDHVGRNLHPLDEDARTLMGARPVAVPDAEVDIAEALDLASDIPVVREDAVEVIADEPADGRRRLVAVPDADEDDDAESIGQQDLLSTMTIPHPSTTVPPEEEPAAAKAEEPVKAPARAKAPSKAPVKAPAKAPAKTAEKEPAKAPAKAKPRARKGRASVPSWDEILFGATKPDDQG